MHSKARPRLLYAVPYESPPVEIDAAGRAFLDGWMAARAVGEPTTAELAEALVAWARWYVLGHNQVPHC